MTTPTSGAISLNDVQTEFGGSNPIDINEYYRGAGLVPAGVAVGTGAFAQSPASGAQIPLSGNPIQLSQFYGTKKSFVFNDVVSSNMTTGYSLGTRASAAGWDGTTPLIATITVNFGVTITGPSGYPAFVTWRLPVTGVGPSAAYPSGSQVTVTNNGNIIGAGGSGGTGGSTAKVPSGKSFVINFTNATAGTAGSPGIAFDNGITTYMINNGTIGGGGGGGGGGNSTANTPNTKSWYGAAGGGGGAGAAANGSNPGGAHGTVTGYTGNYFGVNGGSAATPSAWNTSPSIYTYGNGGAGGVAAGLIRGGSGGAGGEAGKPGFPGEVGDQGYVNLGQGGVGAGGAPGQAIIGGAVPTWYNYGSIRGAFDNFGFWGSGGVDNSAILGTHRTLTVPNTTIVSGTWTSLLGPIWYGYNQNSGVYAGNPQPAGNYTFYMMYTNPNAPFSARLYGAVDNTLAAMTLNGSAFTTGTTMGYGTTYQTNSFTILTGINVITVTINNSAVSATGFNLRLRDLSNADLTHPSMWYY